MRFEWDKSKDLSNFRKHGIRFRTATRVFEDPNCMMEQDREVDGEERWQTIGWAGDVLLLLVAHTIADEDDGPSCPDHFGATGDRTGEETL